MACDRQGVEKIGYGPGVAMVVVQSWPGAPWFELWKQLVVREIFLSEAVFLYAEGNLRPKPRCNVRIWIFFQVQNAHQKLEVGQ